MDPLDPEWRQRVEEIFQRAPFMLDLGARIESAALGEVVATLPVATRLLQQDGFIHAAVQAALADHTAGAAAASLIAPGEVVLTIEFKINLLRPASGAALRCRSVLLRPGRTVSVAESEVWALGTGGGDRLTAKATVTLAVVRQEAAAAPTFERVGVREGYDRWAEIYDSEDNALIAIETPIAEALLGDLTGHTVADVGCGTGRHALRLAARGARVIGLDPSVGMLAKARDKGRSLVEAGALELLPLEADAPLPLPDRAVDRVLSALVLEHVPDLRRTFAEMRRICRPGGMVVVTVMHPAMALRGVQARFRDPSSGIEARVESHPHQIADFVGAALAAGLRLEHLSEHAVDEAVVARSPRAKKYLGWPMLVALAFRV
jgi:malonyl-CoA O-methyltransferase